MDRTLNTLRDEFRSELERIADWWMANAPDDANGGFHGQINMDNTPEPGAEKGCVLNARILWTFSELAAFDDRAEYRAMADRAYESFTGSFLDPIHGGAWWSLNADGAPSSRRKQTYAQGFGIYGLSAYYHLTGEQRVLDYALELARLLEEKTYDAEKGGYIEAFAEDWSPIDDVRLSERDLQATKTMNTHLHILEPYTALYRVHPTDHTRELLRKNIVLLAEKFIAPRGTHQRLFFDDNWNSLSDEVSFGHDIEASWLLHEALEVLDDPALMALYLPHVRQLADACLKESLNAFGEGICELGHHGPERIYEWWCQAEALVGFLNAWQLTGEERYLRAVMEVWQFIKSDVLDTENGDWHAYAGDVPDYSNLGYKAGFWKGPYHTCRALIECARRIDTLTGGKAC
ncbi:hypothetical protein FF098_014520 [Parvularcula flava]|uniref:Cellobiose 2-epimerase n=1 Tax=Aquisalinus luteolus TaxID=1566827 RepID=A0A8J3AA01_9PROT|nr:AGE family epimerase/isomerase [Aquisalinus luteolus]NHK29132.1 hypothetical protein [Aquisalinus luteolus]GGI00209.1 cellobiose 2-epimerase [Aquisalinus luteolus]